MRRLNQRTEKLVIDWEVKIDAWDVWNFDKHGNRIDGFSTRQSTGETRQTGEIEDTDATG